MSDTQAQNRASREQNTREQALRPQAWRPPETLPMPTPRKGWAHRWIRIASMGQSDPANVSSKLREGWEPVIADDYPELMLQAIEHGRFKGNVEVGGLLLCRMPEEFVAQRTAYYAGQTKSQMETVDNNLMREQDPRMPTLSNERRTKVEFGSGS